MNEKVHSSSDQAKPRRVYQLMTADRLRQIDHALKLTGGHFVLAARLIGLSPVQFKNAVNAHQWLKVKWGNKRQGRPRGRATVRKLVFNVGDEIPKDPRSCAGQCLALFEQLPLQEQRRVHDAIRIRTLGRAMAASLEPLRVRSAVIHSLSLLALRERRDGDEKVRPES